MTKNNLMKKLKYYKKLCYIDELTKVYNRRKLQLDIERFLEEKKRYKYSYTLIFIDLDGFKQINDEYGHSHGDKLLKKVATILKSNARKVDSIYRYGGDEFIVVLGHCKNANKYLMRIAPYIDKDYIKISFGSSILKNKNTIKDIDKRMYNNKKSKR